MVVCDGDARSASGSESVCAAGVTGRHVDRRRLSSQRCVPAELWPRIHLHDGIVKGDHDDTAKLVNNPDVYQWYLDLGPLSNVDAKYFKKACLRGTILLNHPDYDAFWKRQGFAPWLNRVTVPTLNVAGWWDQEDFYGPITIYELLERHDTAIRTSSWSDHGIMAAGRGVTGESSVPSILEVDTGLLPQEVMAKFLAHYLKGKPPNARSFDIQNGDNEWVEHNDWPPKHNVAERRSIFKQEGKLSFDSPAGAVKPSTVMFRIRPIRFRTARARFRSFGLDRPGRSRISDLSIIAPTF